MASGLQVMAVAMAEEGTSMGLCFIYSVVHNTITTTISTISDTIERIDETAADKRTVESGLAAIQIPNINKSSMENMYSQYVNVLFAFINPPVEAHHIWRRNFYLINLFLTCHMRV
ncbi:hypothetical protein ACJX0J_017493 [Zea mays]